MVMLRGIHVCLGLIMSQFASAVQPPLVRQVSAIQGLRMVRYKSGMIKVGSLKTLKRTLSPSLVW